MEKTYYRMSYVHNRKMYDGFYERRIVIEKLESPEGIWSLAGPYRREYAEERAKELKLNIVS